MTLRQVTRIEPARLGLKPCSMPKVSSSVIAGSRFGSLTFGVLSASGSLGSKL